MEGKKPTRDGKRKKIKRVKIKPCVHCNSKVKPVYARTNFWFIMCPKVTNGCSDSRGVSGKTRAEVIKKWNKVN